MANKYIPISGNACYWVLAALIYSSLIYSTGLQYAYGPEQTIKLSFFHTPTPNPLQAAYPDLGSIQDENIRRADYSGRAFWKFSSFWEDAGYYVLQAESLEKSIPPYKYRVLTPFLAKQISSASGVGVVKAFIIINITTTLIAALLFTLYLRSDLQFSDILAIVGGMLFVTMLALTRTMAFPMLEPSSMLFSILIFISVKRRNAYLFILSAVGGVLCKEILVVASLMWIIETWQIVKIKNLIATLAVSIVPILAFIIARVTLGGAALEVNYGFDISAGELPPYASRLLDGKELLELLLETFLSFSFLWLGLFNLKKNDFLFRQALVIPAVLLAAFLFSSRTARVLGILFPLVIPMFLLFFERCSSMIRRDSVPTSDVRQS